MKKIIFFILIFSSMIFGQQEEEIQLSGVLNFDNNIKLVQENPANQINSLNLNSKKSPFLAGVLSFLVPGSGEIYNNDYLKSALFIAIEAAAITTGIIYDGKGDDQTEFFENYAQENWSVSQYAQWTLDNLNSLNAALNPDDYNVFKNEQMTEVNWSELNRLEESIGAWYSHKLAPYGDQQYYEMIGKYPQFNPGWNDFDINSAFRYGDPLTENFEYYSGLRGEANDFYTVAKTAVNIIVINHILSAVDAAWSAARHNKKLEMNVSMESTQLGLIKDFYPQLNMKYRF